MKKVFLLGFFTTAAAFAQQPKFEIADVRASATVHVALDQNFGGIRNFGALLREGRYVNRDATMLNLIAAAYGVPEENIAGGPGWLDSDHFDVIAKVPEGTTPAAANLMLRSLLADRFGLTVHQGTHPLPRYVLSVSKSGSKLKPASGLEASACRPETQAPAAGLTDLSRLPDERMACRNLTAAAIAEYLHAFGGDGSLDRDVIDATGLEGAWDFDLVWTPREALAAKRLGRYFPLRRCRKAVGLEAGTERRSTALAGGGARQSQTNSEPGRCGDRFGRGSRAV